MARVLLGVTGGIAAYKACELTRLLVRAGHEVTPILTAEAETFVSAKTFESLARSESPRDRNSSTFARVAACDHMRGFIAGATSTGPRCASAASVRTLSARPCASFASVFAESGATTRTSASARCG